MPVSINRHVGVDIQAQLDDARGEIRDLQAENAALKRDLTQSREIFRAVQRDMDAQRAHYEKEIAKLKQVGKILHDSVAKAHPEYVNQQVAQTNPYAIA